MDEKGEQCVALENTDARPTQPFTEEEKHKVVRKLDLHLLPLCFVLYTFSVLDRSNLGNAKTIGLEDDINLSGNRYEWLGNMFYIAYIIFQFTTLGWKIFKPHMWVSAVVIFWGVVSTLQATATSWPGLMACRFFLGCAETMFGPGIPLYFSFFYPREMLGRRFGIFLSGAALANVYGGVLAYGLGHAKSSISSWKFLFIIEGVPTVLLAVISFFFLPDSPSTARFLNDREREVTRQIAGSQPEDHHHEGLQLGQVGEAFLDYKNYLFAIMNFSNNVSFASLPLFLPTIVSEMGSFTTAEANGLVAPPYFLCFILIIVVSLLSDRMRLRGLFAALFSLLSAIGFILLGTTESVTSRYIGTFLAVLIFVTTSIVLVWTANTNSSSSKRAGGLWIIMTLGQCGPLLGTNMFPSSQAPLYRTGSWVCCAFALLSAAAAATQSLLLWLENRKMDRLHGPLEELEIDLQTEDDSIPRYRYII